MGLVFATIFQIIKTCICSIEKRRADNQIQMRSFKSSFGNSFFEYKGIEQT